MDSEYLKLIEKNNDDQNVAQKAVRRISTYARRNRRSKSSVVLDKVKIAKAMSKKRSMGTQKFKIPELEPVTQGSDAIPQSRIPQPPKHSRHIKEDKSLRQLRPQKVTNAKRFTDASVKSLSRKRSYDARQTRASNRSKRRPAPPRPQPTLKNVITRSGRRSRPPVRWAQE